MKLLITILFVPLCLMGESAQSTQEDLSPVTFPSFEPKKESESDYDKLRFQLNLSSSKKASNSKQTPEDFGHNFFEDIVKNKIKSNITSIFFTSYYQNPEAENSYTAIKRQWDKVLKQNTETKIFYTEPSKFKKKRIKWDALNFRSSGVYDPNNIIDRSSYEAGTSSSLHRGEEIILLGPANENKFAPAWDPVTKEIGFIYYDDNESVEDVPKKPTKPLPRVNSGSIAQKPATTVKEENNAQSKSSGSAQKPLASKKISPSSPSKANPIKQGNSKVEGIDKETLSITLDEVKNYQKYGPKPVTKCCIREHADPSNINFPNPNLPHTKKKDEARPDATEKLRLYATNYHTPTFVFESEADAKKKKGYFPLKNMAGKNLGPFLPGKSWCEAAMEGSVSIQYKDGKTKTFNYQGTGKERQVDCKKYAKFNHGPTERVRFYEIEGEKYPYGKGSSFRYQDKNKKNVSQDLALVPYRTVAAGKQYSIGTVLFIPEAKGVKIKLPNGKEFIHDGYFMVGDRGGLINDNHIDVFTGSQKNHPFDFIKSRKSGLFDAYIVKDQKVKEALLKEHGISED